MPERYQRKPEPPTTDKLYVAQYHAGTDLAGVREVAAMAYGGEAGECELPETGKVLLARYIYVGDHGSHPDYAVVRDGKFLCYSEKHGNLTEDSQPDLDHFYERAD
jgi:hypothetical protein